MECSGPMSASAAEKLVEPPADSGPPQGTAPADTSSPGKWIPTLYFAEGLPNVVTVVVSVLMYKSMGLGDGEIAFFTSLITYPWILKPLWSPLLELVDNKKRIVVLTQLFGGLLFGLLALAITSDQRVGLTLAFFGLIAFISATHDIVADGIYVSVLDSKTQARYVGIQGAAYNIAKFLATGGFVIMAGKLEESYGVNTAWMSVMVAIGLVMILISAWHTRTLPSSTVTSAGDDQDKPKTVAEVFSSFGHVVKTFFEKKNIWWGIAFICLFRFSEGNQVKIVPLFMRATREAGGLGLTTADVGIAYGLFGSAAFVCGSLAGGMLISKRGLRRSLLILCAAFNVPNVCYLFLATVRPESLWMVNGAVLIETFGYGFGFVAITLFMMQQIAPGPYKMAHYAFGTAVMFLGFLAPSSFSGYIAESLGYQMHFVWVLVATIPSFYVAWKVPFNHPDVLVSSDES